MIKPYFETKRGKLYHGDCLDVLPGLEAKSVQMCVTSPPYYGLRAYLPHTVRLLIEKKPSNLKCSEVLEVIFDE